MFTKPVRAPSVSLGRYDAVVVGAGLLGLATARALEERTPNIRVAVLDKEPDVARHQSGHNSGVIHSGVYYKPGSLKARLCREGGEQLRRFCDRCGIRYQPIGKLIVAVDQTELPRLEELHRRGVDNGIGDIRMVDASQIPAVEPHAAGVAALHLPSVAVVDYSAVALALAEGLRESGVEVRLSHRVLRLEYSNGEVVVDTDRGRLSSGLVVNCAGLQADVVARSSGSRSPVEIVPFRGEYYLLRRSRSHLVRGLIYPVPDPELPFLGVHFTPRTDGSVEAGPNAVLALAREGYSASDIDPRSIRLLAAYPGFYRMAARWWRTGISEVLRSASSRRFVASLKKLVPEIQSDDVVRAGAGVRAQAVRPDGSLADDFVFSRTPGVLHVLNAPSPGATASLAIGRYIAEQAWE
ncbi:MAG TPA: L-2-hydroxyglutarate oxidase [Chloroflexota bacterium]|nr:L-2-hydroxyglutarate oxidase [Chloroflexota bacterium]